MSQRTNRRSFIKTTAALGVGYWAAGGVSPRESRAASETINFACIGVGGKGASDSADAAKNGNVVAVCDIDEGNLDKGATQIARLQNNTSPRKYFDWRKMLDEMGKSIDAVTVSTPDHTHAPASAMALKMGIACFTQKPMTHTLYEARRLGELARENKVATQMGNQGTSEAALRRAAAVVKAGTLGNVSEIHVWTNRPVWPQGLERPTETPDVPPSIHWDLFVGPAPYRPYHQAYHPFKWRGWWDFGTGALGDMACHTLNLPFAALALTNPVSVVAETSGHNYETYPGWSVIDFEYGATATRPAVKMRWYDGGKMPPEELFKGSSRPDRGSLIIGERGALCSPGDYGGSYFLIGDIEEPEVEYTRSPGHFKEFANAIKTGEPAMSNFPDYATPLTETVLLGNLALWAAPEAGVMGKKIEWDNEKLEATNAPEVAHIVRKEYREGYSL